ncbi:MAG: LTA synthase family protein [Paludibacteraceae bacterium]|nr:LTA synthase family protein [Paludibacteraceae bacterium]
MKKLWRHPWTVAVCNLLLVMALYTCMRLFCYAVNDSMFPDMTFAHFWEILCGGMRFDLTAVLYLSSLYIIMILLPLPAEWRMRPKVQQKLVWLFWIPNAIGILVNMIDIVYIRFTDRRTTCTFFSEFQYEHNLWRILCEGIWDYWYVGLLGLIVLVGLFLGIRKHYGLGLPRDNKGIRRYYVRETAVLLVSVYLGVIGIRGGFGRYTRPITISNAMQYVNNPRETALVLNTPFCLMKSLENTVYEEPAYFAAEELANHMNPVHTPWARGYYSGPTDNIVVLILESFSTEYIGFYNQDLAGHVSYTPFLDSLLAQSLTFEQSFAAGRKSIDAMPSVLSSIPSLIEPYIVTPYSTNAVSSIAECLGKKGYQTAFFHGAPNGSMGFQAYARSAGFSDYYGKDEFEEAHEDEDMFDGTWAIWDEPFLQYYAETMSGMAEPFMTAVFTASSHHPFKVPEQYKGVFPKGNRPIHQTIGYADYALRRFFETASQQPWFERTLFVITGDHTNELSLPEYTNAKGLYEVPNAFYHPNSTYFTGSREEVISQTDIMPSVLSYVDYDEPYIAFGEDAVTSPKIHPYAVCYNEPLYQIFSDSLLVQFDGTKVTAVYDYRQDPCLRNNIAASVTAERVAPMTDYLKGYIQQYVHRMVNDELKIKN